MLPFLMPRTVPRRLSAALAAVAIASAAAVSRADLAKQPSVVFILADDLGQGDVGFAGCTDIATPHIDRIAAEGVRFTQFYVASQCSPTRAALLTGRFPWRIGMQGSVVWPWSNWGLPPEETTIAETLRTAGYATMIAGKWHLGQARPELLPLAQGFDHHYGMYSGYIDHVTHCVREDGKGFDWFRDGAAAHDDKGYATELVAREAAAFVRSTPAERPFFLYVAFPAPHAPLMAPPRYVDKHATLDEPRRTYAAMVACMDDGVGEILAALDETGRAESTLVVFAGDNGPEMTDDRTALGYGATSAGLRAGKGTFYEGGMRSVAAARWPGTVPPGIVVDEPVHIVDWNPTMREMAGLPVQEGERPLDGLPLLALLKGERHALDREILPLHVGARSFAVRRSDGLKLVGDRGRLELFDLESDPGESRNLVDEDPDAVAALEQAGLRLQATAVPPLSLGDGNPRHFVWPDRVDRPPQFSSLVELRNRPNLLKALGTAAAMGVLALAMAVRRLSRRRATG